MAQRNPSKFVTNRQVDDPLVQDALFTFDQDDRQYIDNQIRGLQQYLIDNVVAKTIDTESSWAPRSYPGTEVLQKQSGPKTTDATEITALEFDHADHTAADYTATVLGRGKNSTHFGLDLRAAYESSSGTFNTIRTPATSDALPGNPAGWTAAFDRSGSKVRVRVKGEASLEVQWSVVASAQIAKLTANVFDPATLTLTGWWRGSFTASPWVGTASAGPSSGRNLSEATNPPAAGTAQGGYTPADFDGVNDKLASTNTFADFFGASSTAWSGWILCKPDTLAADNTYTSEPHLLSDSGGNWAVSIATSGVRLTSWTTTPTSATTPYAAISTGVWSLVQFRWTGTQIQIRVNGSSWQSASISSFWSTIETLTMLMGKSGATANFFDGKILDCGLDNSSFSDAQFDQIRSYVNARYAVSV